MTAKTEITVIDYDAVLKADTKTDPIAKYKTLVGLWNLVMAGQGNFFTAESGSKRAQGVINYFGRVKNFPVICKTVAFTNLPKMPAAMVKAEYKNAKGEFSTKTLTLAEMKAVCEQIIAYHQAQAKIMGMLLNSVEKTVPTEVEEFEL